MSDVQERRIVAADLAGLVDLDEAQWLSTNAPIASFNYFRVDPVFLMQLDVDDDGRIRAAEVKATIRWLLDAVRPDRLETSLVDRIADTSELQVAGATPPGETVDAASLRDDTEVGRELLEILRIYEQQLPAVNLERIRERIYREVDDGQHTRGLLLPSSVVDNAEIEQLLENVIATVGGAGQLGREQGMRREDLNLFRSELDHYFALLAEGPSEVLPFGRDTRELYELTESLREKFDQFFALCNLLAFRELTGDSGTTVGELDLADSKSIRAFLEGCPLAPPTENRTLEFESTTNRSFAAKLAEFRARVLAPILGQGSGPGPAQMDEELWHRVETTFEPYAQWRSSRPGRAIDSLSFETLSDYHGRWSHYAQGIEDQFEDSLVNSRELAELRTLEKLILFQKFMLPFVNSFVRTPDLYDPESRALFEMGTLIMDGRHFTLSAKVVDRDRHAKICEAGHLFVLYAEISKAGHKLYDVAVPVTSGTRGGLRVGKVGIFVNVANENFHAEIVKIVDNPISLGEAIAAPFERLGRAISTKLDEISRKAEKAPSVKKPAPAPAPAAYPRRRSTRPKGGVLAGGGIAVAALGSSLAFITKTLSELSWADVGIGLLAAAGAIVIPATIAAEIKLSRRNLGAVLEGAGWGINRRMKLVRHMMHSFTHRPQARRDGRCSLCQWPRIATRWVEASVRVVDASTQGPIPGVTIDFARYPAHLTTGLLGEVTHSMRLPMAQYYLKAKISHPDYEPTVVRQHIGEMNSISGDPVSVRLEAIALAPKTVAPAPTTE